MNHETRTTAPTLLQVVSSVAASFLGVQSSRNRERDFTHGKPWQFIVIALVMTGAVAAGFYLAAVLALRAAGL